MTGVGIDNLRAGLSIFADLIVLGIQLVKKAPSIVADVRDLDVTEGITVVVDVATIQAPKVIEALKA